jgi:hypothetical protein
MSSIDDAIFLMDGEVIDNNTKYKKKEKVKLDKGIDINKLLKKEDTYNTTSALIQRSPPIDIIKPQTIPSKTRAEFFPSSPYVKNGFSAPAIL